MRWPSGKVSSSGPEGFRARNPIPLKIYRVLDLLHAKLYAVAECPPAGEVSKRRFMDSQAVEIGQMCYGHVLPIIRSWRQDRCLMLLVYRIPWTSCICTRMTSLK
ncbi:hypothetical protein AVEN_82253-1 [Araneus ventricosus]|uniref:Uncharacterized protein n=1 Tax=Araneus ventricosus TaxID=182803 RepID=A0A4Y2HDP6_ARAVE|nr:hypothetical protein AVEN_82253-1 [Araneus ventricosus]